MSKYLFFLLPLLSLGAFAQEPAAKISGLVLDENKQPLPAATVLLLKAGDSTLVKSTLSNAAGNFTFDQVTVGEYLVSVSLVGYQKQFIKLLAPLASPLTLSLLPTVNNLKIVTVTPF